MFFVIFLLIGGVSGGAEKFSWYVGIHVEFFLNNPNSCHGHCSGVLTG